MQTQDFIQELKYHFTAKTPCIWVNSLEEKRAEQLILKAYNELNPTKKGLYWSIGFGGKTINPINGKIINNADALRSQDPFYMQESGNEEFTDIPPNAQRFFSYILNNKQEMIYIVRDYPDFNRLLSEQRMIRDIYERNIGNSSGYSPLVIISTTRTIPLSLQKLFVALDLDLLNEAEVSQIVDAYCTQNTLSMTKEEKYNITKAALGLTKLEIGRIFNFSLQKENKLDTKIISTEKMTTIKKSSILTYIEPHKTLDTIGGHAALKEWIKSIKACMSPEAEEFGIKAPKGTIFMGPGGTGKVVLA